MADSRLQILIDAAVSGLDQVSELGKEIASTAENTQSMKHMFQDASTGMVVFADSAEELAAKVKELQGGLDAAGSEVKDFAGSVSTVGDDLDKAGSSVSAASDTLDEVGESAGKAKTELENVGSGANVASDSFDKLAGLIKKAVLAYAGFIAAVSIKSTADIAARNETLGVTLDIIGKNAGYSTEQIKVYEDQLKSLGIATGQARDSLIQMMQAGLQVGASMEGGTSQIAELARAAQDLAVVSGENSSETLSRMITNIQQLDTLGMRYMGVMIDANDAYNKFAQSIGKSASELSNLEKQQAFLNATLERAKGLTGAYEASMDTVGKKLSSLKRYQDDLSESIGKNLLPAYGLLVDKATDFLKYAKGIVDEFNKTSDAGQNLADGLAFVFDTMQGIFGAMQNALSIIMQSIAKAFDDFKKAFSDFDVTGAFEPLTKIFDSIAQVVSLVILTISSLADEFRLLVDTFGGVIDAASNILDIFMSFAPATAEASAGVTILKVTLESLAFLVAAFADGLDVVSIAFNTLLIVGSIAIAGLMKAASLLVGIFSDDMSQAIDDATDSLFKFADEADKRISKTASRMAEGDTNINRFLMALDESRNKQEQTAASTDKLTDAISKNTKGFDEAESVVLKYVEAVRTGELKGEQARQKYEELSQSVRNMGVSYGFTTLEMEGLEAKLVSAVTKATDLSTAFTNLGISAGTFANQTSDAGTKALSAFNALVDSGKYASEELYRAFSMSIVNESSLAGLEAFKLALVGAFDAGKLSAQDYESSLKLIKLQTDETVNAMLKMAKTDSDFANITREVNKLTEAEVISAKAAQMYTNQIAEAKREAEKLGATRINTLEREVELSRAATDVMAQRARLYQADINYQKQLGVLEDAKAAYAQALNKDKKEGTELSKAELALADAQVQLEKARANMMLAVRKEEAAALDVLAAKQAKINALKKLEQVMGTPAEAAARRAVEMAEKEVQQKEIALNQAKQQRAQAEMAMAQAEQTYNNAVRTTNALRSASGAAGSLASNMGQANKNAKDTYMSLAKGREQLEAMGLSGNALNAALGQSTVVLNRHLPPAYRKTVVSAKALEATMARVAAETARASAEAAELKANFANAKIEVDSFGKIIEKTVDDTKYETEAARILAAAWAEVKEEARQANLEARESAKSFLDSALSVRIELLQAQGKEEEATKLQFEQRKRDLALEYQILQVKIQSAIAQGKIAGVSTSDLEQTLVDVQLAYEQSVNDIEELEKIRMADIAKRREEERKQAEEKKKREAEEVAKKAEDDRKAHETRKGYQSDEHDQEMANMVLAGNARLGWERRIAQARVINPNDMYDDSKAPTLPTMEMDDVNSELQLIAKNDEADNTPKKVVEVELKLENEVVRVDTAEGDDDKLLSILQNSKRVA